MSTTVNRALAGRLLSITAKPIAALKRVILVGSSSRPPRLLRGLAEIPAPGIPLRHHYWIEMRERYWLRIKPTSLETYPGGRMILHFKVLAAQRVR